ncbi:MAG: DUF6879 family protein [Egibacteraceae bacterium]
MLSEEELDALFTFERSAFRLEAMDYYAVDTDVEELSKYLDGQPRPSKTDPEYDNPWFDFVRSSVAQGKRFYRVHVVHSPLSEYLCYECEWGYAYNMKLTGEEVHILDTAERPRPQGLPNEDFWLLDDIKVIRMHYDVENRFVGGELLPESEALKYCRYRDLAVAAAVPFDEYWAAHPQYWRESWLKPGK